MSKTKSESDFLCIKQEMIWFGLFLLENETNSQTCTMIHSARLVTIYSGNLIVYFAMPVNQIVNE